MKFLFGLLLLFLPMIAVSQTSIATVATPPSGSCSGNPAYELALSTNAYYPCTSGTWGSALYVTPALLNSGTLPISATTIAASSGITATSDGVHAGYDSLVGNTANPAVVSNTAGFMGPASASFTGYAFQLPSTAPTAGQVLAAGTPVSNVIPLVPTTVVTPTTLNSGTLPANLTQVSVTGSGPGVISYASGNASTNPIPSCTASMAQPWPTATVTDATTVTSGATYVSGGSNFGFVACNGSTGTWIVLGGGSGGGGGGNPTFVSSVEAVGAASTNPSTTATLSMTAGNLLVLYGGGNGTITGWNSPSGCATWTSQGSPTTGSSAQSIWTGTATSAGSCVVTFSATSSSSSGLVGVLVQTSNATSSGIVLSSYSTTACPSCTGSTLTTTAANSLVLTFTSYGASTTLSSPSPFAFDVNGITAGGTQAEGHYVQASTGLYTPTWTAAGAPVMANVSVSIQ